MPEVLHLHHSLENLKEDIQKDHDVFFIDENVKNYFPSFLNPIILPGGDKAKDLENYSKVLVELEARGINRDQSFCAIGGGATSDFVGFVASTWKRGVTWSVVPTTLLSMVDACLGGKTALNFNGKKNLIGTFYPAKNIFLFEDFLETLSPTEWDSGKGEILKYCFLDERVAKAVLEKKSWSEIIKYCLEFKQDIVTEDLREVGVRRLLNLGHTLGHGVEIAHDLPHGVAVALGVQRTIAVFQPELNQSFKELCSALELVLPKGDFFRENIKSILFQDKKISLDNIYEAIPIEIGKSEIRLLELNNFFNRVLLS